MVVGFGGLCVLGYGWVFGFLVAVLVVLSTVVCLGIWFWWPFWDRLFAVGGFAVCFGICLRLRFAGLA